MKLQKRHQNNNVFDASLSLFILTYIIQYLE